MKYYNKKKHLREIWTKVSNTTIATTEMKRWCQLSDSKGRFFVGRFSQHWYFEYPEDATAFILVWKS